MTKHNIVSAGKLIKKLEERVEELEAERDMWKRHSSVWEAKAKSSSTSQFEQLHGVAKWAASKMAKIRVGLEESVTLRDIEEELRKWTK